jgi:hypothetical protein
MVISIQEKSAHGKVMQDIFSCAGCMYLSIHIHLLQQLHQICPDCFPCSSAFGFEQSWQAALQIVCG